MRIWRREIWIEEDREREKGRGHAHAHSCDQGGEGGGLTIYKKTLRGDASSIPFFNGVYDSRLTASHFTGYSVKRGGGGNGART